jgi:hypothetical protein
MWTWSLNCRIIMCDRMFVKILVFSFNSEWKTSFPLSLPEDLKLIRPSMKSKWFHLKTVSFIAEYKREEQEKLLILFKNLNLFIGDMLLLRLYNSLLLHADSYHKQQTCSCWWHNTVPRAISVNIAVSTWHDTRTLQREKELRSTE